MIIQKRLLGDILEELDIPYDSIIDTGDTAKAIIPDAIEYAPILKALQGNLRYQYKVRPEVDGAFVLLEKVSWSGKPVSVDFSIKFETGKGGSSRYLARIVCVMVRGRIFKDDGTMDIEYSTQRFLGKLREDREDIKYREEIDSAAE